MLPDMSWISESSSELGEGPCWHPARAEWTWVDITGGGVLHRYDPSTGEETEQQVARTLSFALPTQDPDELVVGTERGIELYGPAGLRTIRAWEWRQPSHRFNDAIVTPAGGLVVGVMHSDGLAGQGTLHHVDSSGRVTLLREGLAVPNGMAWLPGDDGFYFADTMAKRIDFVRPTSTGASFALAFSTAQYAGMPDGMTADADGTLWVAFWDGGAVRRFSVAGELLDELPLETSLVTSAALGGPGGDDLLVTTARGEGDRDGRAGNAVLFPARSQALETRLFVGG
jgi:sugar lactone lactonase YvrE